MQESRELIDKNPRLAKEIYEFACASIESYEEDKRREASYDGSHGVTIIGNEPSIRMIAHRLQMFREPFGGGYRPDPQMIEFNAKLLTALVDLGILWEDNKGNLLNPSPENIARRRLEERDNK